MKRIVRIVGSFFIVVACYGVYARLAVPWIEPPEKRADARRSTEQERKEAIASVNQQRAVLKHWFAKGDWELTTPKVLKTPSGMLLLRTYQTLPGNKVRIEPCTMVFLPEGHFTSEEEWARRAVVLQAPDHAVLEFDRPFDLRRSDVGKLTLVGGDLVGEVLIRSDQRSPGPEDDLRVVTHDVKLENNRLTTPHPIAFDYGPNHGEGREMLIELTSTGEKSALPPGSPATSVKSFHLARDVKMRLFAGDSELLPGGSPARPKAASAEEPEPAGEPARVKPPVEIVCAGPFHLDLVAQVATFTDEVDVVQVNFEGPSDQLTCDVLSIEFETSAAGAAAPPPGAAPNETAVSPKMRPKRITADGKPLIVNSPSKGLRARGRRLEYDVQQGSGELFDKQDQDDVMIRQDLPGQTREIHARRIRFEQAPGEPSGRPSVFLATGQGWLTSQLPQGGSGPIEVRWSRSLHYRPCEEGTPDGVQRYQLVSVNGSAHVASAASGSLDADTIDLWLVDAPAAAAGDGSPPLGLEPRKLWAQGHVRIESEQVTGVVADLKMWFQPKPPPPPAAAGPAEAAPPPPPPQEKPQLAKRQHFHVSGDAMQIEAKLDGPQPEITRLVISGQARAKETQTEKPGERPLLVEGDQIQLEQPAPEQGVVSVIGKPAHIDARGLKLMAGVVCRVAGHQRRPDAEHCLACRKARQPGTIHLARHENRIWVKGPGTLSLPADRDLEGRPTNDAEPIEVDWQDGLEFDGLTAEFRGQVEARQVEAGSSRRLRTPAMDVGFAEAVRFDAGGSAPPQIDTIVCRQGARVESREFEPATRTLLASEYLVAADLTLYQVSGDVLAHGPGTFETVRVDRGETDRLGPGGAIGGADEENAAEDDDALCFLAIRFQREMSGNLHRKTTDFFGRVRAVYGPVHDWQARLNPDDPEELDVGGFTLRSEHLQVAQQSLSLKERQSFELTAAGNAEVEAALVKHQSFVARAANLTYDMRKGLLVLDGQGGDARLFHQERPGGAYDRLVAKMIHYYPKTQRVSVDGSQSGDMEFITREKQE